MDIDTFVEQLRNNGIDLDALLSALNAATIPEWETLTTSTWKLSEGPLGQSLARYANNTIIECRTSPNAAAIVTYPCPRPPDPLRPLRGLTGGVAVPRPDLITADDEARWAALAEAATA